MDSLNPNEEPSFAAARPEHALVVAAPSAAAVVDCWNKIGVNGNSTCPELPKMIHCRNCPVYSAAGKVLLDRELPVDYRRYWTEYFSREKKRVTPGRMSVVLFRLGGEWLALSTGTFQEVAEWRKIHSLPHRRNGIVLGLVNVRGELRICVSLGRLLGIESDGGSGPARGICNRLVVAEWQGNVVTFPVDEVHGVHRFHPGELKEAPATVARANPSLTRGILAWNEKTAGCLDEESLFSHREPESGMKNPNPEDLSNFSMVELFQVEAENQIAVLINGLLELERQPGTMQPLEGLMRAAHSFKGAARIVNQEAAVSVAHAMEDCFVAAQQGRVTLRQEEIDVLFQGVDLLLHIARSSGQELVQWQTENVGRIEGFRAALKKITQTPEPVLEPAPVPATVKPARPEPAAGPLARKKRARSASCG